MTPYADSDTDTDTAFRALETKEMSNNVTRIGKSKFHLTPLESLTIICSRFHYSMDVEQEYKNGPWKITATPRVGSGKPGRAPISCSAKSLDITADKLLDKILEQE